jgi:hypothetical protein
MSVTLEEAMQERDEGIERSFSAASEAWKTTAIAFVEDMALRKATFTADDLWLEGLSMPPEPRALGGVLTRCVKNGVITKSGQYAPSVRRHATPIIVWKSLVAV